MNKIIGMAAFLLAMSLSTARSASAQQAVSDIDHVTDDGTVVLQDGTAWETPDPAPQTWNDGDHVIVTDGGDMVNTDQDEVASPVNQTDIPDEDENEDDPPQY
jgi:hypothetical protein